MLSKSKGSGGRVGAAEPAGLGLVVSRRNAERVRIGPIGPEGRYIWLTVARVPNSEDGRVRLGVLADADVPIHRGELVAEVEGETGPA